MSQSPLKVAVLMGGIGHERQVSLESGIAARDALKQAGHDVVAVDIQPDKLDILDDKDIDVYFIALHGVFGEDGQLQSIMEERGLAYTGSGPEACRLAFDKLQSKKRLQQIGIDSPPYLVFEPGADTVPLKEQLAKLGSRFVIKPICQGSSVGISIVQDVDRAIALCGRIHNQFGGCLVEQYIQGKELTVGVLLDTALPAIEIRPKRPFYDYQAKYNDDRTEFLFGTLPDTTEQAVQRTTLQVFNAFGMRHIGRIDMILSSSGKIFVLEANAIPGLTSHSLLPRAAAKAGIAFWQMCDMVVRAAYERHTTRHRSYAS